MNARTASVAVWTFLLLSLDSFDALADRTVVIAEPIRVIATEHVARGWVSFDDLSSFEEPSTELIFESEPPISRTRVDVLVRRSAEWRVISSGTLASDRRIALPRNERVAVFVRFERTPSIYAWADVDRVGDRVALRLVRNVRVEPFPDATTDAVLFAGEAVPLTHEGGILRAVPLSAGLFCVGHACAQGASAAEVITLDSKNHTRVLRTDGGGKYELNVFAPGTSTMRAITVAANVVRSGVWSAVTLPDGVVWSDVVIDIVSDGAIQRVTGASLLPLPSSTDVRVSMEKGVVVRPLIGPEKTPHGDAEAVLDVFPTDTSEESSKIAIASARLENEVFTLPELGFGRYLLKIFSPEATGEPVTANLTPGVPAEVSFARGPVIRGRVVRRGGGSPGDPIVVEIIRQTPVTGQSSAIADWIRNANADMNGKFRLTLTVPGPYRLRARWGTAQGEMAFVVKDMMKDVELGEITLDAGALLRGTLTGCIDGELRLVPLPDLTKPMMVPFFDLRRIPVATDGTFVAEGLTRGEWIISALCGGVATEAVPTMVVMPESGVVFLDVRATPATH